MTLQWVSLAEDKKSEILYRSALDPSTGWKEARGDCFPFPHSSLYLLHRVELKDLQPETAYCFKLFPDQKEALFRTAPLQLKGDFRFVVGGDMYHDGKEEMIKTCRQAAQTEAAFALVGGDIAYAVGGARSTMQNIERWIEWIKMWHTHMVTPKGYSIPVMAAIGNHDLPGHFNQSPNQALIFSALFPMPGSQIYNVLDFGSYLTVLILDSGHANPIGGVQTEWLKKTLEEKKQRLHRFAIYHVPAYPCIRHFYNSHSTAIRHFWTPLFEQGGLHVAFEHHDHAYKRTVALKQNHPDPAGVVYLGDGGWGVDKPRTRLNQRVKRYLAKFSPVRHFISVTLTPTQQSFKSISDEGVVIDEYVQNIKPVSDDEASTPLLNRQEVNR